MAAGTPPLLDDSFPLPLDRPFTTAMATASGVRPSAVRSLVQAGLLRRLVRGVYVAAQCPDGLALRAAATRLVVPHAAVVTDWSACWFWTGIDAPGGHEREPVLDVAHRNRHSRLRNDLVRGGARTLKPSDVVETNGLLVTSPLRTAYDLGRLAYRDRAIGGMDALARHCGIDLDELVAGVDRFKGMRGVRQLRGLAPWVDPRAESPGESLLRLRWLDMPSLPRPTPQVPVTVCGVEVYRLDLAVPELLYACEYDGEEFHQDEELDDARRADLARRFAWAVEAVGRENVSGPRRDVDERLVRGVEEARRTLGRRRRLAMQRTTAL